MRNIIAAVAAISFLATAAQAGEKEDRLLAYLESMTAPVIMLTVEDCARSFPEAHDQFMLCAAPVLTQSCAVVDPLYELLLEMGRQNAADAAMNLAGSCYNLEGWLSKGRGYHYRSTLVDFGRALKRLAELL